MAATSRSHTYSARRLVTLMASLKQALTEEAKGYMILCLAKESTLNATYPMPTHRVTVNTFNTPGVMGHFHFLKVMEDAQKIRKSVIDYFEKASPPNLCEEERRKILHFVIIGDGPTGVEFVVELHDFLVEDLVKLYPAIEEFVKITIMQSGEHTMRVERSCSNNLSFGQDDQGVAKL
ncbi:hypothetical protein VPH35_059413 [Triticum aestivum]